ncbi:tetratricopeptide repeat protein [bacterium]|nr:tetratricopeptide repeat protein [bacterium]
MGAKEAGGEGLRRGAGYYGQALRAAPGDLALKYEEAQCLSEAGRHEDALARAQQLCRANPLDAVFAWFLGSEFYKLGRMEEARATFDQLLARHPGNAFAHSYLSYIYTYSKQHRNRDKALYHAEEALRLFDSEEGRADARRHLATIRSHDGPFKDQS